MARRRYYRRSARVVVPKKKWATNMKSGTMTKNTTNPLEHMEEVLVSNSTQVSTPTPVIVKTGNFKVQGDCYLYVTGTNINSATQLIMYVVYLPEVVVNQANPATAIQDHPEWIMGWKVVDLNLANATNTQSTSFSFSSRLKRNLNSGDTVALVALLRNGNTQNTVTYSVNYTCQYWTCSN